MGAESKPRNGVFKFQNAPSLTRVMVVRRRCMAASVAMALVQKRGGTPKIDVAPKQWHERCAMGNKQTRHDGPGHLHKY